MESRTSALAELKSTIAVNDDVYAKLVNLRKDAENDVESLSDMLKGPSKRTYLLHTYDCMHMIDCLLRALLKSMLGRVSQCLADI